MATENNYAEQVGAVPKTPGIKLSTTKSTGIHEFAVHAYKKVDWVIPEKKRPSKLHSCFMRNLLLSDFGAEWGETFGKLFSLGFIALAQWQFVVNK